MSCCNQQCIICATPITSAAINVSHPNGIQTCYCTDCWQQYRTHTTRCDARTDSVPCPDCNMPVVIGTNAHIEDCTITISIDGLRMTAPIKAATTALHWKHRFRDLHPQTYATIFEFELYHPGTGLVCGDKEVLVPNAIIRVRQYTLTIQIRGLGLRHPWTMTIVRSQSVLALKMLIWKTHNIPMTRQSLVIRGQEPDDHETLGTYCTQEETLVYLGYQFSAAGYETVVDDRQTFWHSSNRPRLVEILPYNPTMTVRINDSVVLPLHPNLTMVELKRLYLSVQSTTTYTTTDEFTFSYSKDDVRLQATDECDSSLVLPFTIMTTHERRTLTKVRRPN
jgi:hypothetical protein